MKKSMRLLPALLAVTFIAPVAGAAEGQGKKIVSSQINPLVTVRLKDRISAMNHIVFEDGQTINRWDGFDCSQNKAVALYWDMLDEKEAVVRRFYGSSYDRYAAPVPNSMLDDSAKALCQSPVLKNASWVFIEKKSKYDTPVLLDTASVVRTKDLLIARIGFEYDEIQFDPPYDAPHDMKIEVHAWNCATQKDHILAGLDITQEGYVSDSLTGKAALRRSGDFSNTPATEAAFKQLCALPAPSTFKGEGPYIPSTKTKAVSTLLGPMLPDLSTNAPQWLAQFPLSAEVEKQALQMVKPWAQPRFRQMKWTMYWGEKDVVPMVLDVQPDGLMLLLEDYKVFRAQRLTMANLGQLKGGISLDSTPAVTRELHSNLRFPLYQGQKFTFDTVSSSGKKDKKTTINRRCEVTESAEASQINSAFSGRYWKVVCNIDSDGSEYKETFAWLSDLNVFIQLTQPVKGKEVAVTVKDVQITR